MAGRPRRRNRLVEKLKTEHVELSCVGQMYSPVGSRDPVSNSAANSTGQILNMFSFNFSTKSVVNYCEFNLHRPRDATQLGS